MLPIVRYNKDIILFAFSAGVITTKAVPNFETMGQTNFPLVVTVTDTIVTVTSTVTLTVNNVNEAPVLNSNIYRTTVADGAVGNHGNTLLTLLHRSANFEKPPNSVSLLVLKGLSITGSNIYFVLTRADCHLSIKRYNDVKLDPIPLNIQNILVYLLNRSNNKLYRSTFQAIGTSIVGPVIVILDDDAGDTHTCLMDCGASNGLDICLFVCLFKCRFSPIIILGWTI